MAAGDLLIGQPARLGAEDEGRRPRRQRRRHARQDRLRRADRLVAVQPADVGPTCQPPARSPRPRPQSRARRGRRRGSVHRASSRRRASRSPCPPPGRPAPARAGRSCASPARPRRCCRRPAGGPGRRGNGSRSLTRLTAPPMLLLGHTLDALEVELAACRGSAVPAPRKAVALVRLPQVRQADVAELVEQLLACSCPAAAGTGRRAARRASGPARPSRRRRGRVVPRILCISSSISSSGTISPPILANRDSRPVSVMNPSASMLRHVAGDVPAAASDLAGQVFAAEVALHHVRPGDEQQPFLAEGQRLVRLRVDDAHGDAGQRVADGADLGRRPAGRRSPRRRGC